MYAEYFLVQPSAEYKPFFDKMLEKIYLTKILIEYLDKHTEAKYPDFLERIQITVINEVPPFTEESILRHAPFLCEQVFYLCML